MTSIVSRQFGDDVSILAEAPGLPADAFRPIGGKEPLQAECINTLPGLIALESDWRQLEADCADSSLIFQTYDWCSAWAETFLPASPHITPLLVALRDRGTLVCLLPAMICNGTGPRVLRTFSEPFAQYGGILCHPGWQTDATLDALFRAICAHGGIDLIHFRHVRDGSLAHRFAMRHLTPAGYRETAPFMDLSGFGSDEAYQARYTKVQRRRRKKIATALEEIGPLSFTSHSRGAEYDRLVHSIVGNKQAWIGERGLLSTVLADPRLVDFLTLLGNRPGAGLEPVITAMTAGGRCVSHELGLRYRGRHCAFMTGHDPDLTGLSPARLHMDRSQRAALAAGIGVFDLMVPGDPYKASWSCAEVAVADHVRPLTARGWLHANVQIRLLRPLARLAYQHSPAWLRQAAMPLVHRLAAK